MHCAVVYRGVAVGFARLARMWDSRGETLSGMMVPTTAYETIRDVCEGPVRLVREAPALDALGRGAASASSELRLELRRRSTAIASLGLQFRDESGEVVPTGPVAIHAVPGCVVVPGGEVISVTAIVSDRRRVAADR
jgi:hypothetical protein